MPEHLGSLLEQATVIPAANQVEVLAENFDVFDFELSGDELEALDTLGTGVRGGPEPKDGRVSYESGSSGV
jgi:2,5-diketo-D-gluconate reductase A